MKQSTTASLLGFSALFACFATIAAAASQPLVVRATTQMSLSQQLGIDVAAVPACAVSLLVIPQPLQNILLTLHEDELRQIQTIRLQRPSRMHMWQQTMDERYCLLCGVFLLRHRLDPDTAILQPTLQDRWRVSTQETDL